MGTNLKDEPHAWVSWPLSGLQRVPRLRGAHDSVDWTSYGAFSPTNSARQVATQSLTFRVGGLVSLVSRTWRPSRVCGSGSSMFSVLHILRGRTQHPAPRKPKPSRALSHDDLHICPLMCSPPCLCSQEHKPQRNRHQSRRAKPHGAY